MRKSSVRNKLIFFISIAMLLPVVLIGVFSYNRSSEILEQNFKENNQRLVFEINHSFTNFLEGIENQVHALVEDETFASAATGGLASNGDGDNIDYKREVQNLLENAKNSNKAILKTRFTTDKGEHYLYPYKRLPSGYDSRKTTWYQDATKNKGQAIWTEPYTLEGNGEYIVTVAKTVISANQVVGVISMDMSLHTLGRNFAGKVIGKEGYVFVTDREGIVVYHPDSELFRTDTILGLSFWETAKSNPSGTEKYEYKGDTKQLSFATNKRTGWKIMATMNIKELHASTSIIRDVTLYTGVISFILSIGLAFTIALFITRTLKKLKTSFSIASEGDLTTTANIKSKDEFGEIGNSFNKMLDNIKGLIKSVKESSSSVLKFSGTLANVADEISVSSNEVSATVQEIAASSNEQAKDSENGARQVNDLAEKIEVVSDLNEEMNNIAIETGKLSDQGLGTVKVLIQKTDETNKSYVKISDLILEVDKSSDEISTITETIGEIAEQTNLLALNAAIEAARAGEHGQGFAVVADEVRKLAEESSMAAQKVREIINEIQTKSDLAVVAMNESKDTMSQQEKAVDETESIFIDISKAIKIIVERVGEIKEHSTIMSEKKNEIVSVIENLSAVSEETSAATEQVSAATEEQLATMQQVASQTQELKGLADKLQEVVSMFIVDDIE